MADTPAVANENDYMVTAAKNHDLTSLSTYAGMLSTDNQTAIDDSDLYNVSPDLQGAKDEYAIIGT